MYESRMRFGGWWWNRFACSTLRAMPVPKLTDKVELAARVEEHLKKMGASWK